MRSRRRTLRAPLGASRWTGRKDVHTKAEDGFDTLNQLTKASVNRKHEGKVLYEIRIDLPS